VTKSDAPVPVSERRQFNRYPIWFPVTLEEGTSEIWGICRDAGRGGLLVAATKALAVGAEVSGRYRTSMEAGTDRRFSGRVVRCSAAADEMVLAFPFRVAIAFSTPDDELEELLKNGERV
jgi:hypothetical protein